MFYDAIFLILIINNYINKLLLLINLMKIIYLRNTYKMQLVSHKFERYPTNYCTCLPPADTYTIIYNGKSLVPNVAEVSRHSYFFQLRSFKLYLETTFQLLTANFFHCISVCRRKTSIIVNKCRVSKRNTKYGNWYMMWITLFFVQNR